MFGALRRLLGEFSFRLWTCATFGLKLGADVGQIWYHSMTWNDRDGLRGPGREEFPVELLSHGNFSLPETIPFQ